MTAPSKYSRAGAVFLMVSAALLGDHRDGPARGIAGLMFLDRTDHSRDRQSVQHHSRFLTPILSEAATSGFFRISNLDGLHTSPLVTVRETVRDGLHDIEQPLIMIPIQFCA